MPYAARPMADDEKNKQAQNISGGAGANFAVNVPGQEPNQKSSGQYTNIQSYLDANKDQAAGMGQNVTKKVDESASGAQSKIQSFGSAAPKVEAYDPNEAYKNIGSLDDQQKSQYNQARAGYAGPESTAQVSGYEDVQKSYNAAKTKIANTQSETGQQQLLRDTYARPQYTGGENKLDQVLLQNNADSRSSLEGLNQKYSGLNDLFKTTNESVGKAIDSSKVQAASNQQKVLAGEQDQWKGLIDPIQARADKMNVDNPALYNRISQDTSDNVLNDETLQRLGIAPGTRLFDTQIGSYLKPNLTNVGLNEAANADERSKYAQLSELVGDKSRNQIDANGKAADPLGFDADKFQQDLGSKQSFFDNLAREKNFNSSFTDKYGRLLNSGSANVFDFLQQNQNFGQNPDQTSLDFNYNPLVDEAPWYVDDPSLFEGEESKFQPGNVISKIAQPGQVLPDAPDVRTQRANQQIKSDLYKQIQDFLNSQNYNRVIQKG